MALVILFLMGAMFALSITAVEITKAVNQKHRKPLDAGLEPLRALRSPPPLGLWGEFCQEMRGTSTGVMESTDPEGNQIVVKAIPPGR